MQCIMSSQPMPAPQRELGDVSCPFGSCIMRWVDFSVPFHFPSRSGLEGQLLGVTIQQEQPELEHAKSEMLRQEESFKVNAASVL